MDALGNCLLHLAAMMSDYKLIKLLVEKGADVTSVGKDSRTPLHVACETKSLKIVKFLTEKSPACILQQLDSRMATVLDIACRRSCPEIVQFLLSQRSSVHRSHDFLSPGTLLQAVCNTPEHAIPIASLLLEAGVNTDCTGSYGKTALITAIGQFRGDEAKGIPLYQNHPRVELCTFLIDRGCDVNAADCFGKTALHLAVDVEQEILVQKLLFSGSHVDYRNNLGYTALYYACKTGNQKIIDLLINFGANLRVHDWENTFNSFDFQLRSEHQFSYVIQKSRHCFTLENLCLIAIRRNIKNLEKGAIDLGLPPLLLKRLQLKE
ncbi:putative ankyrin repeat protein, partial [Stegodyphus mimosarum]